MNLQRNYGDVIAIMELKYGSVMIESKQGGELEVTLWLPIRISNLIDIDQSTFDYLILDNPAIVRNLY